MVLEFVLAFAAGALAKIADEPPHGSFNFRKFLKYGSGLSYGIAGGYLLSVSPVFSALVINQSAPFTSTASAMMNIIIQNISIKIILNGALT